MANARPSWTGELKIASVRIPVQIVPASDGEPDSPLVTVHAVDDGRLSTVRRCTALGCGKDVTAQECVQAVEVGAGVYSRVTADELEALATPSRKTVDLVEFRGRETVDWMRIEKPYWVMPDPKFDDHAGYDLLRQILQDEKLVGGGKISFRSRERWAAVYCIGGPIALLTMRFVDEIRSAPPGWTPARLAQDMVEAGLAVVRDVNGRPAPAGTCRDEYTERLNALIARKRSGRAATSPEDLESQLKRSVVSRRRADRRRKAAT